MMPVSTLMPSPMGCCEFLETTVPLPWCYREAGTSDDMRLWASKRANAQVLATEMSGFSTALRLLRKRKVLYFHS